MMSLQPFWAFNVVVEISICVPKINQGRVGLECHEVEKLMEEFKFLGELSF